MGVVGGIEGGEDILDDRLNRQSPPQMCLRADEDLGVTDVLAHRARQIGLRDLVEILARAQDREAEIIEVEERLQAVEDVGAAQRGRIGKRQAHAVALCEREQHLRLERAFQMHVQLRLRQVCDERWDIGHGLG